MGASFDLSYTVLYSGTFKIRALPSETLFQTLDLENFATTYRSSLISRLQFIVYHAQSVINWAVVGQPLQFVSHIVKLCLQHDFVSRVSQRQLILVCMCIATIAQTIKIDVKDWDYSQGQGQQLYGNVVGLCDKLPQFVWYKFTLGDIRVTLRHLSSMFVFLNFSVFYLHIVITFLALDFYNEHACALVVVYTCFYFYCALCTIT